MPCFAPGTDQALIQAFEDVMFGGVDQDLDRFQADITLGQATALNPGGASQGDPTILTYSFPG